MCALLLIGLMAAGAEPVVANRPVADWLRDLEDKDPLVREEAVEALAGAGPAAREAGPKLEKLAREGPLPLRVRAGLALWRVAGKTGPVVEALAESLRRTPSVPARTAALQSLQQLGSAAAPAVPAILEVLDDPEQPTYAMAQTTLSAIGAAALPVLKEDLEDKGVRRRRSAARALAHLAHLARTEAPALRKHLDDADLTVRACCARILWFQMDTSAAVVGALTDAVRAGDAQLRRETFTAATAIMDPGRFRAIRPLLKLALGGTDPILRVRAAQTLYLMEHKTEEVLPVFLEGLKDKRYEVWSQAALGIGRLGAQGAPALPDLMRLLETTDEAHSFGLHEAFAGIGAPAVGPLVELLTSGKATQQTMNRVSNILYRLGPTAAPKLLPLLQDPRPPLRQFACQVLGSAQEADRAVVPRLIERLDDDDQGVRQAALTSLSRFGPNARSAVPRIIEMFHTPNQPDNVRFQCVSVLEQIGGESPALQALAREALEDRSPLVRSHALLLLQAADPANKELVPRAVKLLDDPVGLYQGMEVLRRLGSAAAPAVPALRKRLQSDPNPAIRLQVVMALGAIGPAARAAGPDLVEVLGDRNLAPRSAVVSALRSVGGADPAKLVPILLDLARTAPPYERGPILDLLGDQGPAAAAAAPVLLEELQKPQGAAYEQAARALAKIAPERARKEGVPLAQKWLKDGANVLFGARLICLLDPGDKDALQMLRRPLRTKDPGQWVVRQDAASSLGALGPAAREAAPELKDALKDNNPEVRLSAALALWRVSPQDAGPAVQVLIELLDSKHSPYLRQRAVQHLQEMGPAAKEALPALRRLLNAEDLGLRSLSATAVRTLERQAKSAATDP